MRIAYLDCCSGISGDMTLGALVDAGADLARINASVQSLGLPGVEVAATEVKKKGFRALQVRVLHEPEHKHRHLHHIEAMIDAGRLTDRQKETAKRIFRRLGEAEAKVHGVAVEKVHFHEVGAADSIADIVGVAVGFDLLGVEKIACSAVPTGTGYVEIAHGRVAIPAPATAELLRGVPLAPADVAAELTTPTGAAIVATLAESFGPVPAMRIESIGYGAGERDLEDRANLLRLLVGEAAQSGGGERLWMLETNVDDTSGELIGHCVERLWAVGPRDVYTTAIQMKKNRPGTKISVLCREGEMAAAERILFEETTTLGIRRWEVRRTILERQAAEVPTPYGPVQGVEAFLPGGGRRFSPEYESCREVALRQGVPLQVVYEAAKAAFAVHVESAAPTRNRQ